jgi:DNA-binding transcriptional ArsR family regulator
MATTTDDTESAPSAKATEGLAHPDAAEIALEAVLHALSDPVRLQIVRHLAGGHECTCKSFDLPVTKSTATYHFRVLRESGVVRQRIEGTTRLNALRRDDLNARFPGLLDAVLQATAGAA